MCFTIRVEAEIPIINHSMKRTVVTIKRSLPLSYIRTFTDVNSYSVVMKFIVIKYGTPENSGRGKNCELFTKIFPTNIHRYTENVFGICTDCSLFAEFFLTNSFYGLPKFYPAKIFPCTYLGYHENEGVV